MQLHAVIKKSSKYYSQNNFKEGPYLLTGTPIPFPVAFRCLPSVDSYCFRGNENNYRREDLTLYAEAFGELVKL